MARAPQMATPRHREHPGTPAHLATCETCQHLLLFHCEGEDHRRCHLHPALDCEVSARWLEPVREAARAALREHGDPAAVAVVSRPLDEDGEPEVHGVAEAGQRVRRLFWDAKRRLGLETDLALHGRLFAVHPDDDLMPLR